MKQQKVEKWILIIIVSVSFGFINPTESDNYKGYNLFKVNRSRDANEIMYDINIDKAGKPDKNCPINIYWIKRTKQNRIEPLTWIQKKYSYGIKFLDTDKISSELVHESTLNFQFVSYNRLTFTLKKANDNTYKVFTSLGKNKIEVTRIFVQIDGGSFWLPSISKIELHGIEIISGNAATKIFYP